MSTTIDIDAMLASAIEAGDKSKFWAVIYESSEDVYPKVVARVSHLAQAGDPTAIQWMTTHVYSMFGIAPDAQALHEGLARVASCSDDEMAIEACLDLASDAVRKAEASGVAPRAEALLRQEAVEWLEAAMRRATCVQTREIAALLAWLLTEGRGVPIDVSRAIDLFVVASRIPEPGFYVCLDTSDPRGLPIQDGKWVDRSGIYELLRDLATPELWSVIVKRHAADGLTLPQH